MTATSAYSMLVAAPDLGAFKLAVLIGLLLLAAIIDLRTFRIPNWLSLGGALAGLALNTIDSLRPMSAFLLALGGLAVGLLIPLPLYALRVMGAGDVKLMAMVGSFLGLWQIVPAVLIVFATGGIAALVFVFVRRNAGRLAANLRTIVQGTTLAVLTGQPLTAIDPGASVGRLPYGVSISAGTIVYLAAARLGYL